MDTNGVKIQSYKRNSIWTWSREAARIVVVVVPNGQREAVILLWREREKKDQLEDVVYMFKKQKDKILRARNMSGHRICSVKPNLGLNNLENYNVISHTHTYKQLDRHIALVLPCCKKSIIINKMYHQTDSWQGFNPYLQLVSFYKYWVEWKFSFLCYMSLIKVLSILSLDQLCVYHISLKSYPIVLEIRTYPY